MTRDEQTQQPLRLPASYADAPNALITELLESIERDSVAYSKKWFNGNRRAVNLVAPILDRVGIESLEGLSDTDALGDLRMAVSEAVLAGELGAPSSAAQHLSSFSKRCASLGLPEPATARLRSLFNQARKDVGRPIIRAPMITGEMLAAMVAEMDSWARAPLVRTRSNHRVIEGVTGYKGRRVTAQRRDRALAFIALQVSGAIRRGAVLGIRAQDVRGLRVTAHLRKGRINPEPVTFELIPSFARFVTPLLESYADRPDVPMFGGNGDGATNDVRALLLAAGWPEHYGRTGLHGARKAFIGANYEAGRSAGEASAGLTNSPAVAERIYAEHTRDEQATAARSTWSEWVENAIESAPEWRFIEDEPGVAWSDMAVGFPWSGMLSPWSDDEAEGGPFSGLWRFRSIELLEPWGWSRHVAYESSVGDLCLRHHVAENDSGSWVPDENGQPLRRTLWLQRGELSDAAPKWWARQDLNLSLMVPVEAIISAYAALVIAALDDDELDEARRLLSLLESLGGEPA